MAMAENDIEIFNKRRRLIEFLALEYPEITQCEIAQVFKISQPAVSKYLNQLGIERAIGITRSEKKKEVICLAKENPGMTQERISEIAGISQPYVSRLLRGERTMVMKSTELKQRTDLVSAECPECDGLFAFPDVTLADVEGMTTDCNRCGALLIVRKGRVYEMHKYLNSKDSRWPADGKHTGAVEVLGDG